MMNADRLFMLVDTCANIDEVKHEFPNLDFLTYFFLHKLLIFDNFLF